MDKEQKYTLDEARQIFAEDECSVHGHDYEHIVEGSHVNLVRVFCGRCGSFWNVSGHGESR